MKEITAIISYPGDLSVGIFPATWEITGGLFFEDDKDREAFRELIDEAFEFVTDGEHYVTFSDEWPDEPEDGTI